MTQAIPDYLCCYSLTNQLRVKQAEQFSSNPSWARQK